jgi:hypothetical protein
MKHAMIFGTEVPCLENNKLEFNEQNNKVSFNYTNAFVPTHNRGLLNAYFWGTMART